jgi:hypothetical protein
VRVLLGAEASAVAMQASTDLALRFTVVVRRDGE